MALNVFPNFSSDNPVKVGLANSVLLSKFSDRAIFTNISVSNLNNIFVGQFRKSVMLALKFYKSIFNISISSIIGISSQKKVIRINAGSIVAFMADEQSIGYFPINQLPTIASGYYNRINSIFSNMKIAISVMFSSSPVPTFISSSFVNFTPKSLYLVIKKNLNNRGISISDKPMVVFTTKSLRVNFAEAISNVTSFIHIVTSIIPTRETNYNG